MQPTPRHEEKNGKIKKGLPSFCFDLAYAIFGLAYSPVFLKKIKQEPDPKRLWEERSGRLPGDLAGKIGRRKVLWLHAVSVGEVMAIRKFLTDFLKRNAGYYVILTTVTPTGQKMAREMQTEQLSVLYFPFDMGFACRSFFETLRPDFLLLAETEIWPNLLTEAGKANVPVGILNARLSERSSRRYRRFGFIFEFFFKQLNFVLAQTQEDANRFLECGVPAQRVQIAGNMKFDNTDLKGTGLSALSLKQDWGLNSQDHVWIAGSTHPGEEEILLRVFLESRKKNPSLKLLIAPRHIERSAGLEEKIRPLGFQVQLASRRDAGKPWDVLVLDQLGVLKDLYKIADTVFMGGSLIKHGGQNPIEPAVFKKPILHGPFVFNFKKIYEILDQEGGALCISNEKELLTALDVAPDQESARIAMGTRAFDIVSRFQGATERHLVCVENFLAARSQERTNDSSHEKLFPKIGARV